MQWNTKVKYLVEFPISYSIGAFLVHQDSWSKVPSEYQPVVKKIINKYVGLINDANKKDNQVALDENEKIWCNFP